jgi:hypothetical protein
VEPSDDTDAAMATGVSVGDVDDGAIAAAAVGGGGLVEYSGSSDDDDDDDNDGGNDVDVGNKIDNSEHNDADDGDGPPDVAPSNVELRGPRQVITPTPGAVAGAADGDDDDGGGGVADGAQQGAADRSSTAEQRLAELEQSLEDPHKRLKAGKFKTSLLERVIYFSSFFFYLLTCFFLSVLFHFLLVLRKLLFSSHCFALSENRISAGSIHCGSLTPTHLPSLTFSFPACVCCAAAITCVHPPRTTDSCWPRRSVVSATSCCSASGTLCGTTTFSMLTHQSVNKSVCHR